jgi:oxygen-independent coproporphyrinogen-3 oxidase
METQAAGPATGALPPHGLYLHIPFCISVCPYCDFVVLGGPAARGPRNRVAELVAGLLRELDLRTEGRPRLAEPLASVYLGGGTPSLLEPGTVAALLGRVDDRLGLARDAEVTLEANPGLADVGDLVGFRAAGVTRLSLGVQSLHPGELRRLGRRHGPDDVRRAVRAARAAGFASLGMDLLTDIPGQTVSTWRRTLTTALELAPDHLSVYALTLDDPGQEGLTGETGDHLPPTAGALAWRERARGEQSEARAAEMELLTDELAEAAGLRRYEIANLARPGHESRHNLLYWRRRPVLALGPGAHAFDGVRVRTWNAARLDGYLAALAAGRPPPGGREVLDGAAVIAESAMLGLRLREGIAEPLAACPQVAPALAWGSAHGLVERVDGRSRLTQAGRLLASEVFVRLLPDERDAPSRRPRPHGQAVLTDDA